VEWKSVDRERLLGQVTSQNVEFLSWVLPMRIHNILLDVIVKANTGEMVHKRKLPLTFDSL
jgi:hypothetical protein